MKQRHPVFVIVLGVCVMACVLLTLPKKSSAIPAFAKKYGQPCAQCHTPVPKLNDFGNQFRDRGYQMKGLEDELAEKDLPTNLPSAFLPIAMRASVGYAFQRLDGMQVQPPTGTTADSATQGGVQFFGVRLMTAGTTARDVSFNMSFNVEPDGRNILPYQLWVRLDNLAGSSLANLKVGKFELDLPFSELRSPTFFIPYVPYHYTPGNAYLRETRLLGPNFTSPFEYANRAPFDLGPGGVILDNPTGAELQGHTQWAPGNIFRYTLTGLFSPTVRDGRAGFGSTAPGFYGHVTQSFGGAGITSGHRIGLYGLWQQAATQNRFGVAGTGVDPHSFFRLGTDVSTNFDLGTIARLNVFGVYTYGEDSRHLLSRLATTIAGESQTAKWHGWFVEGNLVKGPYALVLRYDGIRNSQQGITTVPRDFNNVDSGTIGIRRMLFMPVVAATVVHLDYNLTRTRMTAFDRSDQTYQIVFLGFDFVL